MPSPACNTAVLQARCVYQDSQFVLLDSKSNKLKTFIDSGEFPIIYCLLLQNVNMIHIL